MYKHVLLILLLCTAVRAFPQSYVFRNLYPADGILSGKILRCAEDAKGYIWMVTSKGVVRFDGKNFTSFGKQDGLTENQLFFVIKTPQSDSLFFISFQFKLFVCYNGKFTRVQSSEKICWITLDEKGKPYFLTRTGHIMHFNHDTLDYYHRNTSPYYGVHFFLEYTGAGNFLVSVPTGIEKIDSNGRRTVLLNDTDIGKKSIRTRIFRLSNGRLLYTCAKGIYEVNAQLTGLKLIYPLQLNDIMSMQHDPETQDLWIGTFYGLWCFKKGIIDDAHKKVYLAKNNVSGVFRTSEKLYLLATYDEGLLISSLRSKVYTQANGLTETATDFIRTVNKQTYAISSNARISLLSGNHFVPVRRKHSMPAYNKVRDVFTHRTFIELGFEVADFRVIHISGQSAYAKPAFFAEDLFLADTPATITSLDTGWCITEEHFILPRENFTFIANKLATRGATSSHFLMVNRNKGTVYYTSDDGFIEQQLSDPRLFVKRETGSDILCMLRWSADINMAGTQEKGLAIISDTHIRFVTEKDGLSGNYCKRILKDHDCLWALTDKGLSRLHITPDGTIISISNFNQNNLLPSQLVNDFNITDSLVYVATSDGVVYFDKRISIDENPPHVFFTRFSVNNHDTILSGSQTFPYDYNNISIACTFPSIVNAGKTYYRYVLIRNEDTLADNLTKDETLQFFSLSQGEYTIAISAMGNTGKWSPAETMRFTIQPVFWRTWWFSSLGIALLILIITTAAVYKIRANRKEGELRNRLTESELKALRLHMNPHFIFNTLNSLQRFILKEDPLVANEYISRFSQLMRWVIKYSNRQELSLEEEIDFLKLYIELEQLRSSPQFKVEIETDDSIDLYNNFIPSLVILPFIENAIKYALSDHPEGLLQLHFSREDGCIAVHIIDNGPGREKVKKDQENSVRQGNGTGIKYTEERLKLLINDNAISPVVITDLYTSIHTPAGTSVRLLIPMLT